MIKRKKIGSIVAIYQRPRGYNRGGMKYKKAPTLTSNAAYQENNLIVENRQGNHVYEVKDGQIEIKGKRYPIRLPDGHYIIRKLTVTECERLQTLPPEFTAYGIDKNGNAVKISDTQRYKCIGNGWNIDTISNILSHLNASAKPKYDYAEQIQMEF